MHSFSPLTAQAGSGPYTYIREHTYTYYVYICKRIYEAYETEIEKTTSRVTLWPDSLAQRLSKTGLKFDLLASQFLGFSNCTAHACTFIIIFVVSIVVGCV